MENKIYVLIGIDLFGKVFLCQFDPEDDNSRLSVDFNKVDTIRKELRDRFPSIQYIICQLGVV